MLVHLCYNLSPHNKIMKNVNVITSIEGQCVGDFNEGNPTIRFQNLDVTNVNYAIINGKQYFVDLIGINHISNEIVEINFRLDLLSTYSDYIKSLTAYVERDSTDGDDLMPDNMMQLPVTRQYIQTYGEGINTAENTGTYILVTSQNRYDFEVDF